jgi:DNA-binding IclR family transcriptional regulator
VQITLRDRDEVEYHRSRQVLARLDRDRQFRYAYSKIGRVKRGAGKASPFDGASGTCTGAITLSAPIEGLTPTVAGSVGPAAREAALQLSHRLGYSGESWGDGIDQGRSLTHPRK